MNVFEIEHKATYSDIKAIPDVDQLRSGEKLDLELESLALGKYQDLPPLPSYLTFRPSAYPGRYTCSEITPRVKPLLSSTKNSGNPIRGAN